MRPLSNKWYLGTSGINYLSRNEHRGLHAQAKIMEKIVWLDRNAVQVPIRKPRISQHEWTEYPNTPVSEVKSRLKDATIAITNRTTISRDVLTACPKLRFIAVCGTGYDCVDVEACKEQNVQVSNVRSWAVSVAEHCFGLMLALRRKILEYHQVVNDGTWASGSSYTVLLKPVPQTLSGSVLGIVGFGALAKMVVKIAEGFGMHVMIADRKGGKDVRQGRTSFEDTLKQSDVLLILCPLSEETRNLIGTEELKMMKESSILVNCARGGIVNEQALADAVKDGSIAGTATDVLTSEPPKNGNPLVDANLPNIIVTPHVAWYSSQSLDTLVEQLIGLIEAYVEGNPKNLVT